MVVNCGQAFLAWIKQDSRGLLLRAFCEFCFFVRIASNECKVGIPKIISAFSNILKPSLKRDRARVSEWLWVVIRKVQSHPHSDPAFKETSTILTNCASASLLFKWPKKKKSDCLSFDHHQEAVKAQLHAVALFYLWAHVFLHVWLQTFWKVVNTSLFQKTWEQNPEKSVK